MRSPKAHSLLSCLHVLDAYSYWGERGHLSGKLIASLAGVNYSYVRRALPEWLRRGYMVCHGCGNERYAHNGDAKILYGLGDAGRALVRGLRESYRHRLSDSQHERYCAMGYPDISGVRAKREAAEAARAPTRYETVTLPDGGVLHRPVPGRPTPVRPTKRRRGPPGSAKLNRLLDEYNQLLRTNQRVAAERKLEILKRTAERYGFAVNDGSD